MFNLFCCSQCTGRTGLPQWHDILSVHVQHSNKHSRLVSLQVIHVPFNRDSWHLVLVSNNCTLCYRCLTNLVFLGRSVRTHLDLFHLNVSDQEYPVLKLSRSVMILMFVCMASSWVRGSTLCAHNQLVTIVDVLSGFLELFLPVKNLLFN